MKSLLRLVVLMFLVLLCQGAIENKVRVCSKQIFLGRPGDVCSIEGCNHKCRKALPDAVGVRGECLLSDICNCIYRC
ncbi:hypothetical protein ABFS83_03G005800 [Erythranthe nasuta]